MGTTPPPMARLPRPWSFHPTSYFGMSEQGHKAQIRNAAERNLRQLDDKALLAFWHSDLSATLYEGEIAIWDQVWRFEKDRRFLLCPAEPHVNTQQSELLLRPMGGDL